ncbi:mitochondrial coenzyme A diphosphatase NUDT8 [Macrosteles quadrilineatus]|uniref:mitochondrial coenzyme A diphosphatase NUDT8 n=1 Tax=Macrosteles quadrilineatus TaxID=74068 RepID=UPI0023E2DE62|nr:mitochondrial coenzyme A diphosphatase NUDT8 [Macrosteles quadrilineatus]
MLPLRSFIVYSKTVLKCNSMRDCQILGVFNYCFSRRIDVISRLSSSYCGFTDEDKKLCIERLKKVKMSPNPKSEKLGKAAVLIPLCCVDGEPSILYTLRKGHLKRHKGQVSFPGGKHDSDDTDLEHTALRETEEELGIPQSSIEVWGHGNTFSAREFNILPVLGYVGNINVSNLKPNPSEVELAFTVPISHFCNNQNCKYTQYRNGSGYILPVYIKGDLKVWGITALITHIVLRSLVPKQYKFELQFVRPIFP